jgi:aromatic ring hydroxylase
MALLANPVSLAEPGEHFAIQFLARIKAKGVDVIARRDIFDLAAGSPPQNSSALETQCEFFQALHAQDRSASPVL